MVGDTAMVCAVLSKQHTSGDGRWLPPQALRDLGRQPALSIERPQQLAHVDNLSLDLDHQERPVGGMPGKQVDEPALAIDRERDL